MLVNSWQVCKFNFNFLNDLISIYLKPEIPTVVSNILLVVFLTLYLHLLVVIHCVILQIFDRKLYLLGVYFFFTSSVLTCSLYIYKLLKQALWLVLNNVHNTEEALHSLFSTVSWARVMFVECERLWVCPYKYSMDR